MPAQTHATMAVTATGWVIPSKMVFAYPVHEPFTKNIPTIRPSSIPMISPWVSETYQKAVWKIAQTMKSAIGRTLIPRPP